MLANFISTSQTLHLVPHPRSQKKPCSKDPYTLGRIFISDLEDGIKEIYCRFYSLLGETRRVTRPQGNQSQNRERAAPIPAPAQACPTHKHPTALPVAISKAALFRIKTTVTGSVGTGHRATTPLPGTTGPGSPFAPLLQGGTDAQLLLLLAPKGQAAAGETRETGLHFEGQPRSQERYRVH